MMSEARSRKVFCLGWHKTGTSTMGCALLELGFKVVGARLDTVDDLEAGRIDKVIALAENFDAFQDVPWAALYQELDVAFPGSKFIFVERDQSKWLKSAARHFGSTDFPMHKWLYGNGILIGNEKLYLDRYMQHNVDVKNYFRGRDNFLNFSLDDGDDWKKLCNFLDKPLPPIPFPYENKGPHSHNVKERVVTLIRSLIPLALRRSLFNARLHIRKRRGLPDPRDRFNNLEANRNRHTKHRERN